MSDWIDKFKLGKSAFIKRDLCLLPLTEAEFEADFFFDPTLSTKDQECWIGMVIEREFGAVLDIHEWSRVLLALCETGVKEMSVRKSQLGIFRRIADCLAEALGIDGPSLPR